MESETKRKSGAITLGISALLILLAFTGLWPFFIIGFIGSLVGLGLFYSGLSSRNQGIMLIVIGLFPAILSLVVLLIAIPVAWLDLKIVFIILFELLWTLVFFIPGIIRMNTEKKYSEGSIYLYSLAPLTIFWGLLSTLIFFAISHSLSPDVLYRDIFFQSFWPSMGLGFVLSLVTIVLAYLKIYI